ncbi:penicillin acylase family protein [Bacillus sp. JJ722]|uniref:penicillin acylase family protein n=1 Tax=Bacillus sp. JJ722 TaxID=3122973 RepID=UPI002FFE7C46
METVLVQRKSKRNRKKLILWISGLLIFFIIAIAIGINIYMSRSLPQIEGEIKLEALKEPVKVVRDEDGVPHITAKNEHDLYIAQGYIQAQDRLFQMDLSRRQASGRLSEVIGESTIDKDKYFRTLGLRRAAEQSYVQYSSEAKEILKQFAQGVNLYINELRENGQWPIEFTILGYKPEDWTEIDSLTIGKYMAFDLGGNWNDQAFRAYLLQTFSKEKAYDLFPVYPKDAPYIIDKGDLDIAANFTSAAIPHDLNGSNNWVISGAKTESGKPLLANDPHLSLATPSIWYQMHLEAPTLNVGGVIFAGIPGIILGNNEKIAWGVTNTGPDVQDLYIEKRNPASKNEFAYNSKWETAEVVKEPIKVKDKDTIDYEVTITRHGPIVSEFVDKSKSGTVLSLRWTALDPTTELEAIMNMNKASNWAEFEKALEKFQSPTQNFVFADQSGTIAYKANGNIPIRKKGDGLLPVPGWTDEYEWNGYIPYNELPRVVNPKEGFIATANNKVVSDEYPYLISNQWAQHYREQRIKEVLRSKDKLTVNDMKDLQMDIVNLQAKEFVPLFIKELNGSKEKEIQQAIQILKDWNFKDDKEASAPLIFNIWITKIPQALFEDQIPDETFALFTGRKPVMDQIVRNALAGNPGPWIKEYGGINRLLVDTLQMAIKDIKNMQGSDAKDWKWGEYHQVYFNHPLSSVSPLQYVFNSKGGLPADGSGVTVQAAGFKEDGTTDHGASWRFVADLNDLSVTDHLVGPGQSGHLKSKWYSDQLEKWVDGTYHQTTIEKAKGSVLTLKP